MGQGCAWRGPRRSEEVRGMITARSMYRRPRITRRSLVVLAVLIAMTVPIATVPAGAVPGTDPVHDPAHQRLPRATGALGQQPGRRPRGAARSINVRTAVGAANILLFDAGDEMQGSLLSNLQQGAAGHRLLQHRSATTPPPSATTSSTGARRCSATASPRPKPAALSRLRQHHPQGRRWATAPGRRSTATSNPYEVFTVGTAPDRSDVGVIGVTSSRDALHHHRRGHRGPVLPRPVEADPALLRRPRRRLRRHRRAQPHRLHRRRLRLRLHRLRRPDPGRAG